PRPARTWRTRRGRDDTRPLPPAHDDRPAGPTTRRHRPGAGADRDVPWQLSRGPCRGDDFASLQSICEGKGRFAPNTAKESLVASATQNDAASLRRGVFYPALIFLGVVVALSIIFPSASGKALGTLQDTVVTGLGWYYVLIVAGFVAFAIWM